MKSRQPYNRSLKPERYCRLLAPAEYRPRLDSEGFQHLKSLLDLATKMQTIEAAMDQGKPYIPIDAATPISANLLTMI